MCVCVRVYVAVCVCVCVCCGVCVCDVCCASAGLYGVAFFFYVYKECSHVMYAQMVSQPSVLPEE